LTAATPARVSLFRYSPALVFIAIVIADARQLADSDMWGHVLWGRELLAHGSLPRGNPYSYSAPGYLWLRHEWLGEVTMGALFNLFGPWGLKLFKFACSAGTICFMIMAMAETAAPVLAQIPILMIVPLMLLPAMQFRPTLFDFLALSAIVALLSRHNWRGSAPLWLAIPLVAIWSNVHGGFFLGIVVIGAYGAPVFVIDLIAGSSVGQAAVPAIDCPRRGLWIIAIAATAAASTLCTFLIPPARDTWLTLIHSILNPMTHYAIEDWKPLLSALKDADSGSFAQKYFVLVLLYFAAAVVSVILTPRGGDAPMVAVAALTLAMAFAAERNIPIAAIAIAPVFANHLGLLFKSRAVSTAPESNTREVSRAGRMVMEILIAVVAISFARLDGVLTPGINVHGFPVRAVDFMQTHDLEGNVLAQYGWGQYVIWHGAPGMKIFIDGRYDLAYPPAVVWDWLKFANNLDGAAQTLTAYPHDFVLLEQDLPAIKVMDAARDWRLIYSDDVARLYARANSPAAHLDATTVTGKSPPEFFP
jgi:hypothetical protein